MFGVDLSKANDLKAGGRLDNRPSDRVPSPLTSLGTGSPSSRWQRYLFVDILGEESRGLQVMPVPSSLVHVDGLGLLGHAHDDIGRVGIDEILAALYAHDWVVGPCWHRGLSGLIPFKLLLCET